MAVETTTEPNTESLTEHPANRKREADRLIEPVVEALTEEDEPNYIVSERNLMALFRICPACNAPAIGEIVKIQGSCIEIKQVSTNLTQQLMAEVNLNFKKYKFWIGVVLFNKS